jgi:uncharacterized protein YndB with AHSA1/START domain
MPDIKHLLLIEAPPAHVFPFVSAGKGFAQWWAVDVAEAPSTGIVEVGFFNRATVYRLEPTRVSPPQEIEWFCSTGQEWSGTKLVFALTPNQGGTRLRFRHADWKEETDYFVACTTVWGELMFRLKSAAEGQPRGPLFTATGQVY